MISQNLPVVICYPAGAGGSMLGSALQSVLTGDNFRISDTGHCHDNPVVHVPNYIPSADFQGIVNELNVLNLVDVNRGPVISGHLRNIVAMHSLCYDLWFIKITFDTESDNEIKFLHEMLVNKTSMADRLKDCYSRVRFEHWPATLEQFVQDPGSENLFAEQHYHTLKNWFWVESYSTKTRTLELSIQDIFLGIPSEKLSTWYNDEIVDKLYPLIKSWQEKNNELYPDVMKLLTS